ncbi:response regulator transcription factor [Rhizobium sp. GCM10022189]|uniref:response regulator transcription factor n=1 Tax=Rhizobium sp. GCM10022189 TaxID=3252654 RepID=UPI00361831D5
MKVAIVDDDQHFGRALARVLAAEQCETSLFGSGADFLRSLHAQVPDCLLLDVRMPGMDGFSVQETLKAGGFAIPIIAISSAASDVAKRMADGGAVTCLAKPVDVGLLMDAVRQAIAIASPTATPS